MKQMKVKCTFRECDNTTTLFCSEGVLPIPRRCNECKGRKDGVKWNTRKGNGDAR